MKTKEEMLAKLSAKELEAAIAAASDGMKLPMFLHPDGRVTIGGVWYSGVVGATHEDFRVELARRKPRAGQWWTDGRGQFGFVMCADGLDGYQLSYCVAFIDKDYLPQNFPLETSGWYLYASSLDEFVAKRAAEMGWSDYPTQDTKLREERDALKAEVAHLTENQKMLKANNVELSAMVQAAKQERENASSKRDIAWAAKMLADGKAVRRKSWIEGTRWTLRGGFVNLETDNTGGKANVEPAQLLADDWELYEPEPETFGWDEALRRMKDGKRVTRVFWGSDTYFAAMAGNGAIVWGHESVAFRFKMADFDATDWREVKP